MNALAPSQLFGGGVTRIHGVGIGGMGVAPLAIYLAGLGYTVTGEDDSLSGDVARQLRRAGIVLGALPDDCDLVVLSSAINARHPTVQAATQRGLKQVRRGEMLAEIVRERKLVAVCGSHGKTTTTAMLITALQAAGQDAGYVLGGLFADSAIPPAAVGRSPWIVAEIDESDGTIANFSPEITLMVNLDWDHVDHYQQADQLTATFAALLARTRGAVLLNQACGQSAGLKNAGPASHYSYGKSGDFACVSAAATPNGLELELGGKFSISHLQLRARGAFNASNATGALAAAQLMGATLRVDALARFPGVRRRQSVLSRSGGVTVIEDYAHHPAEIRALLGDLRDRVGQAGRLIVIFQPHRYSRTAQFKAEFAGSLAVADQLFLLDVYGAGEAPVNGGTAADMFALISPALAGNSALHKDAAALEENLNASVRSGDTVVFVGAGNIDQLARSWLAGRTRQRWSQFVDAIKPELSAETKLTLEEPLANKTTMRVGGAARVYAEPANEADLQRLLRAAAAHEVPVHALGRGSNLIIADEGVDGLVVSLAQAHWTEFTPRDEGRVWVGAGLRLKNLCGLAAKAGLVGFEFLEGIPGNVGGALRMNAGAMGGWMFDIVEEVRLMTLSGEVLVRKKSDMQVSYRHCADLDQAIALGALLRPASAADADTVNRQIDVYRKKRQESQPREPSAGCIFKNPPEGSAGKLIDESGLKGERIGDAEVSPVHANFIVNRGRATGAEVMALVQQVRRKVQDRRGVTLEPEAQLFGRKWEDFL
jgi:UDP-N-acetylmuramate--alanine ligase